jgi:hypothetical protein
MTRGGSTILGLLLGQLPGFLGIGEVAQTWLRGPVENDVCSCGERFSDCPFWRSVGAELGGWDRFDGPRVLALQSRVERLRHVPAHHLLRVAHGFRRDLEAYAELMVPLYAALQRVTGCRWIVDTSKKPGTYYSLASGTGLDLRLVHLVRDPRGVAYSWSKSGSVMATNSAVESTKQWMASNVLYALLERRHVPRHLIRYEALVQDPERHVRELLEWLGEPAAPGTLDFLDGRGFTPRETHMIAGNPFVRHRREPFVLREDDEWRARLPAPTRRLVAALAWPGLLAYGYPLRSAGAPAPERR